MIFQVQIRVKFVSKLGPDLVVILRCKWPISGSHFTHVKFIFNKLWSMILENFQGKSSGKVRGKFVSKSGLNSVVIYAVNGLQITHVNLFSINYGTRFGGDLPVKVRGKFGPNLVPISVVIYAVNGLNFTPVNLFSINYGT